MKTLKNDEIFNNAIALKLNLRKNELEELISWLKEWDDSKDMRDLILNQIHKTRIEIKVLSIKLKVINFIDSFRTPVKKTKNK